MKTNSNIILIRNNQNEKVFLLGEGTKILL